MQLIEILLLACIFALDAFLVAFSCGLVSKNWQISEGLKFSSITGLFQFFMPVAGYLIFRSASFVFEEYAQSIDHWIVFVVFAFLGGKIIKDSLEQDREKLTLSFGAMLLIGVATSIDALAGGVMIYAQSFPIIQSALIIGLITFVLVMIGYSLSRLLSSLPSKILGIFSGGILILLGIKILIQHLL